MYPVDANKLNKEIELTTKVEELKQSSVKKANSKFVPASGLDPVLSLVTEQKLSDDSHFTFKEVTSKMSKENSQTV